MKPHWTQQLVKLGACEPAVVWARDYPSLEAAWAACERGDWMMWIAGRLSGKPGSAKRRKFLLALRNCLGLTAKPHEPIERWYLSSSANASVWDAASCASVSMGAAAFSTHDWTAAIKRCADIARKHYPTPPPLPKRITQ